MRNVVAQLTCSIGDTETGRNNVKCIVEHLEQMLKTCTRPSGFMPSGVLAARKIFEHVVVSVCGQGTYWDERQWHNRANACASCVAKRLRYKTQMCRWGNDCRHGESCLFAHTEEEKRDDVVEAREMDLMHEYKLSIVEAREMAFQSDLMDGYKLVSLFLHAGVNTGVYDVCGAEDVYEMCRLTHEVCSMLCRFLEAT